MIMQKNDRDCLICCLSELLNINYDFIPKFYETYPLDLETSSEEHERKFRKKYDKWLTDNGYYRIMIDISIKENTIMIPYVSKKIRCLGVLKKKEKLYSHMVVLSIKNKEITIFDPKQNSDYELLDIIGMEFIIKI